MYLHHITRSYLNFWLDDDTPDGYEPYVWVYDKTKRGLKNKAPKNIANKPADLYLLDKKSGGKSRFLEDQLSKIESSFLKVAREKVFEKKIINKEDKWVISNFISLFFYRQPYLIYKLKGFANDLLNKVAKPQVIKGIKEKSKDIGYLFKTRKEFEKETGQKISLQEMKKQASKMGLNDFQIEVTRNRLLFTIFGENIDKWARIYSSFPWEFLEGENFITGDLKFINMFPVSPNICIFMDISRGSADGTFVRVNQAQTENVNRIIFDNCASIVISSKRVILENLINQ
jgi:hypothetical protein